MTVSTRTSSEDVHAPQRAMETFTIKSGLTSDFTGDNFNGLWRPWSRKDDKPHTHGGDSDVKHPKTLQVTHPVKLYWPKSRCFDYLYQDAETLLRNYPVQATICLYEEVSSDEESDEEEEEEVDKEQN